MLLVVALLVGWLVDSAMNGDKVARGTSVAGVDVGGLDRDQLAQRLTEISATYADTPVIISTDDVEITTTAGVVGLELDVAATTDQVMETGGGSGPINWLKGLFASSDTAITVVLGAGAPDELAALLASEAPEPVEPTFVLRDGVVTLVEGAAAEAVDVDMVRVDALAAAEQGTDPIEVAASVTEIGPELSNADAQAFVDDVNIATANGLTFVAGPVTEPVDAAQVRSWLVFDTTGAEPTYLVDDDTIEDEVQALFTGLISTGDAATTDDGAPVVTVVDGEPRIEGAAAQACCAPGVGPLVLAALQNGDENVELGLLDVDDAERELLEQYGVIELIAEATTQHQCCQNRVVNIQRFAELMQGTIIEPGEELSLNTAVGRRTIEKGFVEAGVIYRGEITTDVGGGISQFATTFFQASFYGGLDIPAYFPHTIWFSRYVDFAGREGIESTISFPQPDVIVANNTPYPILVWPTWTDTSLTVSLYSTKYAEADVLNQDIYFSGQCRVIETTRVRTLPDGEEIFDDFLARYQPADGIGCDGQPTNPDSITPTAVPAPTATPAPSAAPTATPAAAPTATPGDAPTPTPAPATSPTPAPTAAPTSTPEPTAAPAPTNTPAPTAPPAPTATPEPAPTTPPPAPTP